MIRRGFCLFGRKESTYKGLRFNAKVAPELASSGYCPAKNLYYYGVKIHLVGNRRPGTLPSPRFIGLAPALAES